MPQRSRAFVTINITGLTDKTANYLADAANLSVATDALTPAQVAANASALQMAKTRLNVGLAAPLAYAGLDPSSFDPVTRPFKTDGVDKYDSLLDRLGIGKDVSGRPVVVGTLAGVREPFVNGTGTAASFGDLYGVATDRSGNVYVADTGNNAIRKISPAGVVTTLAGKSYGFADGTGSAASFRYPVGVAVDDADFVYVADQGNNAIRKITPAGVVSTLAGGTLGLRDGSAARQAFSTRRPLRWTATAISL